MKKSSQLVLIFLSFFSFSLFAQTPLGPKPKWIEEGWAPGDWSGTPQTQDNSIMVSIW